jgi:hypothetical protein
MNYLINVINFFAHCKEVELVAPLSIAHRIAYDQLVHADLAQRVPIPRLDGIG